MPGVGVGRGRRGRVGAAAALGAQADHRQEDPRLHAAWFKIAREATDRGDLQLRMQGNAFLGAFFSVSPMLQDFRITPEQFRDAVHKQYVKKFGKLGDAVVNSNMEVMTKGFELVREINVGALEAPIARRRAEGAAAGGDARRALRPARAAARAAARFRFPRDRTSARR